MGALEAPFVSTLPAQPDNRQPTTDNYLPAIPLISTFTPRGNPFTA